MTRRIEKVNELIKKILGQIFLREFEFGNAMMTITEVSASGNLQETWVKITVMPENQEKKILTTLNKNIFHIQQILNKKLNMRPVPRIKFEIDRGVKRAYEIDKILGEINRQ